MRLFGGSRCLADVGEVSNSAGRGPAARARPETHQQGLQMFDKPGARESPFAITPRLAVIALAGAADAAAKGTRPASMRAEKNLTTPRFVHCAPRAAARPPSSSQRDDPGRRCAALRASTPCPVASPAGGPAAARPSHEAMRHTIWSLLPPAHRPSVAILR